MTEADKQISFEPIEQFEHDSPQKKEGIEHLTPGIEFYPFRNLILPERVPAYMEGNSIVYYDYFDDIEDRPLIPRFRFEINGIEEDILLIAQPAIYRHGKFTFPLGDVRDSAVVQDDGSTVEVESPLEIIVRTKLETLDEVNEFEKLKLVVNIGGNNFEINLNDELPICDKARSRNELAPFLSGNGEYVAISEFTDESDDANKSKSRILLPYDVAKLATIKANFSNNAEPIFPPEEQLEFYIDLYDVYESPEFSE